MLATVIHFMQGTPYIYQGEEIGMTNVVFDSIEDYRDLDSLNLYEDMVTERGNLTHDECMRLIYLKGRDNARTPVQWDATANGGFSPEGVTPWIGVNPNYTQINAADALAREDSLFHYYRRLNELRRGELKDLMVYADFVPLDVEDGEVYAYERHGANGEKLLVINNFTDRELTRAYGLLTDSAELVISNYADDARESLRPYEAKVYRISA